MSYKHGNGTKIRGYYLYDKFNVMGVCTSGNIA